MAREFPKVWKDCVLKLLKEGVDGYPNRGKWNKSSQKDAAYLISMEARRLGKTLEETTDLILEWNQDKNDPPVSKDKILTDVVDWVYRQDPPREVGCKGILVNKGLCLLTQGKDCKYSEIITKRQKPPDKWDFNDFDKNGWPDHLRKCYKNGELLICTYEAIRVFAADKELGQEDPIMVGIATIRSLILRLHKDYIYSPNAICRAVHCLEDCGLLKILERGEPGKFSRRSNVYRIIYPIPPIPEG